MGYIGLLTACLFANAGYEVIGVDVNQATLKKLNQGKLPFEEKGLEELFENALPNLSFKRRPEEIAELLSKVKMMKKYLL